MEAELLRLFEAARNESDQREAVASSRMTPQRDDCPVRQTEIEPRDLDQGDPEDDFSLGDLQSLQTIGNCEQRPTTPPNGRMVRQWFLYAS